MINSEQERREKTEISKYIESTNEDVKSKSNYINYYNLKIGLDTSGLRKMAYYIFRSDFFFRPATSFYETH